MKLINDIQIRLNSPRRKITAVIVLVILVIIGWKIIGNNSKKIQFQTIKAERGTLISSVSVSGDITVVGDINITTQASGRIDRVYVNNGEKVTKGQKIAEIYLDPISQQENAAAYATYLSAKNSLDSAQNTLYSLDSAMWAAQRKFMTDAVSRGLTVDDPTYIQQSDDWLAAQGKYLSQKNVINQLRVSLNSAWLAYQQLSSTVIAPESGTMKGLAIVPNLILTDLDIPQKLGTISTTDVRTQAVVNLSEIDAPKIKPEQKTTLTLDALPGKTYTGKVLAINTDGSISSGVVTYPATLIFDTSTPEIYPNMGLNADIIIETKTEVLLIPSAAIQVVNNKPLVRILHQGQPESVTVEVGSSNDTQTEIISGLKEGDVVITNIILPITGNSPPGTGSPFSSFSGGAVFRTGGVGTGQRR